MVLTAIFKAPKKNSDRYDLYIGDDRSKIIGSIYWPKDKGTLPKEFKVNVAT